MAKRPLLIAMDLEGVLVPEVWIAFAEKTGIEELRLTTRDISDYDVLMKHRLDILRKNGLKLADIQEVIAGMEPLPGAQEYTAKLRE
jgi:phosphoserine/homoserine phosphotransferase